MQTFKLTDTHLKLLRSANVGWNDSEFGAPSIDCKRPYANGDVIGDIAKILGFPESNNEYEDFPESLVDYMRQIHQETKTALQIVLSTGKFEAGEYQATDYNNNWEKI